MTDKESKSEQASEIERKCIFFVVVVVSLYERWTRIVGRAGALLDVCAIHIFKQAKKAIASYFVRSYFVILLYIFVCVLFFFLLFPFNIRKHTNSTNRKRIKQTAFATLIVDIVAGIILFLLILSCSHIHFFLLRSLAHTRLTYGDR